MARLTLTTDDGEVLLVREDVTVATVTKPFAISDLLLELRRELVRIEGEAQPDPEAIDLRRDLRGALRVARELRGLSQADVARAVGVSPNTVARWERGERRPSGAARARLQDWIDEDGRTS